MIDKLEEKITNFVNKGPEYKEMFIFSMITLIWLLCVIIGVTVYSGVTKDDVPPEQETVTEVVETTVALPTRLPPTTEKVITTEAETTTVKTVVVTTTKPVTTTAAPTTTKAATTQSNYIGYFKITVYCACSICCGKYAANRPVDANGNVIVKGAAGRVLVPQYSIAVDPKVIPLGKTVTFNGKTYRADDTGGAVKGNVIDIYSGTDHAEANRIASSMKSQYANVYWG